MLLSVFYDWPKPKSMQVEMGQWVTHWPWRPATKLSIVPKVWGAALLPIALIKAGTQLVLTNPWRWIDTSSAHHIPSFGHLPLHEAPFPISQTNSRTT